MQKFFLANNLEVNSYKLLFIITLHNPDNKKNLEKVFNESGLKYYVFNLDKNEFLDSSFTSYLISTYQNTHFINNKNEEKIIEFYLENNTYLSNPTKHSLKCYSEIGMTFEEFLDQFIDDELSEKIREEFILDESSYHLIYRRKLLSRNDIFDTDLDNNLKLLFFKYLENIVYIELGTIKKGHCIFSFESYELI